LLHPADPHIVAIATDAPLATSLPRFDIVDVAGIADFIAACRLPAPAAWN
jgi:molybdopterin-guanine dinucleotide biosynthesis protein B